jgi:hypothetical protein
MLEIECQEHFDKVVEFARAQGREDQLRERLDYLDNFAGRERTRCRLFTDFAPQSFCFVIERLARDHECGCGRRWREDVEYGPTPNIGGEKTVYCPECWQRPLVSSPHVGRHWFTGGLILHGAHDGHGSGSAPTFSCTLGPGDGWEIHT